MRAKIRIPVDPTILPCHRRLYNAVNAFFAAREIDRMVAINIADEAKVAEKIEAQDGSTP